MSNRLIDTTADIGWSPTIDRPSVRRLHAQYLALQATINAGQLRLAFARAGRFRHSFDTPLTDGYLPFAGGTFSAGVGASIAIAFPHFCDLMRTDGTMTDRLISVHTIGQVPDVVVDETLDRIREQLSMVYTPKFARRQDVVVNT